jgi:hypothetical protein
VETSLTPEEIIRLNNLMITSGALLHKGLQSERDDITAEASELVFSDKSLDSKQQEFNELNERAKHIAWTARWLSGFGSPETTPER